MKDAQLRGAQVELDSSEIQPSSGSKPDSALHGLRLWIVNGGMFLGVYLVGLDLTMLSTVCIFIWWPFLECPKSGSNGPDILYPLLDCAPLTDYFGTINDVTWYETAYVLAVYFEVGSVICAVATRSHGFIIGCAVNGIGSAGLLGGALLIILSACAPEIRPVITSLAMSLISAGSIPGPLIAIEINIPIVIACIPTVKPLIAKWCPRLLESASSRGELSSDAPYPPTASPTPNRTEGLKMYPITGV